MPRLVVVTVAAVFLVVACAATGGEEEEGLGQKLKAVEETTEKANTEIGYIIGIAATAPVVFSFCLIGRVLSAPVYALKDTFEAVTTVYRNLKQEEKGEPAEGLEA